MAIEYLLMPERVKKLEGQLAALNCDLARISSCLEKLTDVLGKLFEPQGQAENNVAKSAGGNEYVS